MRDDHRRLAHAGLTFGVPLSEARAGSLVASVGVAPGGHVVELACGWAELLLRVVETHPGTTGVGVDPDRRAVDRGRAAIAKRGLHERVELVEGDPATFQDMGEAVICAGGGQSFGGSTAALRRIRAIVEPGGVVLFGDAYWQRPPGAEARARFGELPVLDGLDVGRRGGRVRGRGDPGGERSGVGCVRGDTPSRARDGRRPRCPAARDRPRTRVSELAPRRPRVRLAPAPRTAARQVALSGW